MHDVRFTSQEAYEKKGACSPSECLCICWCHVWFLHRHSLNGFGTVAPNLITRTSGLAGAGGWGLVSPKMGHRAAGFRVGWQAEWRPPTTPPCNLLPRSDCSFEGITQTIHSSIYHSAAMHGGILSSSMRRFSGTTCSRRIARFSLTLCDFFSCSSEQLYLYTLRRQVHKPRIFNLAGCCCRREHGALRGNRHPCGQHVDIDYLHSRHVCSS